ncbi:aldo/keto reductase [Flagellimonas meridianipacifica]|uniref:Aryl-alcohol dehydrogenase-like predicted oxidoreductase n=1 Tax=Flagellimonas meridianipacifica TaxID=1080225 RepID=A0A2T0MBH6_9FLAO|nr:aldo/keto reductase [Allomuricauda pacifica]PRX54849.1 aryl-alcohol dehydrogenase-like predicted oxidoreductase [Allomuricauda pacifica]
METNNTFKLGDFEINRIGFGTMRATTGPGIWGDTGDKKNAISVIRKAIENGVNFIDTADAYGPYTSELLVQEAIEPFKNEVLVATKGGFIKYQPGAVIPNGHPYYLRTAIEGSLRRLKTETIDLYFLHKVDPNIPIEESVGALAQFQKEGKIKHIGISNVTVDELNRAHQVAKIDAVQNAFNFIDQTHEAIVNQTTAENIAFIAHTPIARNTWGPAAMEKAESEGMTINQMSLKWLLDYAPNVISIPGTSSEKHLLENLQAHEVKSRIHQKV